MSEPADKSDDLIAELAKLMATAPGSKPAVAPVPRPAPLSTAPAAPAAAAPSPIRIPGMDPGAARPAAPMPQAEAPRAPATGTIRIPGMDQPAPVSTSAPVSKFDFGKPVAPTPIKQEPLSSLSERLAAVDPSPRAAAPAAPVRIPSSLTPVSENRSFAEGPALSVAKSAPTPTPQASAAPASDFHFDFGFAQSPPQSASPPRPIPAQPQASAPAMLAQSAAATAVDPIAALIEAEMAEPDAEPEPQVEAAVEDVDSNDQPAAPEPTRAQVVTSLRPVGAPQARPVMAPASSVPQKPANTPIPLKPVSVTPRPPESDRFAISPGVGLNMKPQPGQPLNAPQARAPEPRPAVEDSDPMSEIESLIGEAVRVELSPGPVRVQTAQPVTAKVELEPEEDLEREISAPPAPASQPAPVVPPLSTQFAPRRANLKDDGGARSAEDAILAAAAASGADVGRMEPSVGDESPYRRLKVKPQRSGFMSGGVRQYVGMAVAGTLLLAAGLGLYWVLNMGRLSNATGANAPQLTADATPVKEKPAATTKPATDAAKSPVLAKMDNVAPAPSSEQLVSTDQATAAVTRDVTPAANDDNENGLANRKVRTVTVRPDGTIVSGDDAVAGGAELPVDRPNVPTVPSTEATNLLGNDSTQTADTASQAPTGLAPPPLLGVAPTATDTQVAEAAPTIDPTAVAPVPMQFPVRNSAAATKPQTTQSTAPSNSSVNALVGAQTPNGQIDLLGGGNNTAATTATQQVASTKPAQTKPTPALTKPTPAPAASSGGNAAAYVQLSSQPTEADAAASVKSMTAKYGSLFGGAKLTVQQVDLGQKGIRWRVRLPAGSLSDASSICSQIKAQGGDCFATNG